MPENEKTLTPQEIAEQRKVTEQKKISSVTAPTTPGATVQGPSASEQAITNAYDDAIGQTSLLIKGLEGRRANALQQDETAQRKSRNMQMIAGISDGLASLANLIGVGDRGTNIDMGTGALTPLQQKFENARLERKADIKSIDDRLDQYRRQLDQMRMQKGLAVAQQKERERADAKEQSRFNIEMAFRQAESKRQAKERENALAEQTRHNKAVEGQAKVNARNDYNLRLQQINQAAQQAGLKGNFPVLIGENEMLNIPKDKINEETIGRIFTQLPQEYQDIAQGKPMYKYEDDGMGGSVKVFAGYEQPTLEQKLAAIGAASRTDKTIQDELRKLAGTYNPNSQASQTTQTSEIDNAHLNPLGTMSMDPSSGKSTTNKVNWNQFE